jgi:hypothetical protein
MTAGVAACGACHVTTLAQEHRAQTGGNTRTNPATKDANSKVVPQETCVVCHGSGAVGDVAVVHKLAMCRGATARRAIDRPREPSPAAGVV